MPKKINSISLLSFVAALFSATSLLVQSAYADSIDFTFVNKSKWKIEHVFISAVNEDDWGPDQLDKQVIESAETFVIKNVTPGTYDIKVVDEDSDECVVEDVAFTKDQVIEMNDQKLVACQAATKLEDKESTNEEE